MKKILITAFVSIGITAMIYTVTASDNKINADEKKGYEIELKTALRKLWEDHVVWTRNVIFNIMDDLPGKDQAVKRLLKNQDDIGNAMKPYYGAEATKKLTTDTMGKN